MVPTKNSEITSPRGEQHSSQGGSEREASQEDLLVKKEELKLKAKYPQALAARPSAFLQKRLAKGQKYFDSGDYNMHKQAVKGKAKANDDGASGAGGGVGEGIPMGAQAGARASAPPEAATTGTAIPTPDTVPVRKIQPVVHAGHPGVQPKPPNKL